jgi:hypothetical protein
VSALTPISGPAGTVVTITGTGFSTTPGTTDFDFGDRNAAIAVSCSSSTTCNATAPLGTGTVDITASVGGLTSISSAAVQFTYIEAIPPAPSSTQLQFITEPSSSGSSGEPFATSPVVDVDDASGVLVSGDTSLVTLTITTNSPAGSTLTCASGESVAAVGGQAVFSGCQIIGPTGSYSLTATDGMLTPAASTAITVGVGTASQLVFSTEPPVTAIAGVPFSGPVSVSVEDSGGNLVTTDNSSMVTLGLDPSSPSGTLSCDSNSVQVMAGLATFTGCLITGPDGTYEFDAGDSAYSFTAVSSPITVSG